MPRLTITLPENTYKRISELAFAEDKSLANAINKLIQIGMYHLDNAEQNQKKLAIEKHCQQLIIQMNVLLKSLSAEVLNFKKSDFAKLKEASAVKYKEIAE